ncbi:MAG: DinB family protein [Chloroflexi bacterium]|nr:DinB family protein [Chloroflexota bacterium]
MTDTPEFLAKRLRAEGEKMSAFFSALTDAQWQRIVYTEGAEWRVRDVLAHFVSAERSFLSLFASILGGGSGTSEDFSVDRFNASQVAKMREMPPAQLMDAFAAVRAEMADWVASLREADLQKTGRHPFLGETTLAEMVKLVYRHNQIHYRDLRKSAN